MSTTTLMLKNGTVVDPAAGTVEERDLFVTDGRIAVIPDLWPDGTEVIDCTGLYITPGLIDVHVHLREPGGEESETIRTGAAAAAHGGFTTIVSMPNTTPAIDSPEWVGRLADPASCDGLVRIIPSACISKERLGREPADLHMLAEAGAGAFTDDGATVQNDDVMREGMKRAAALGLPVLDHAQDREIEKQGGVMHEGRVSKELGLPGIPTFAETRIIERDIRLAEETGCRLHIQHVTSAEGADLIRQARQRGLPVTGEATPHHLALCDEDIDPENASFKMNPPLRSAADREAIREAVQDGTLSILATDHAPHPMEAKNRGFLQAPFGLVGLETAVAVTYEELVLSGRISLVDWIRAWTLAPAELLGLPPPSTSPGAIADLAVLNLSDSWKVIPGEFLSKGRNTPFAGRVLKGKAVLTLREGKFTWKSA